MDWNSLYRSRVTTAEEAVDRVVRHVEGTGNTAAEAVAHGTRFLFVPREDFREVGPLLEGLTRLGCARAMPREDFAAGRWRSHLDALFEQPAPPPAPDCNGAEVVAAAVLERLS